MRPRHPVSAMVLVLALGVAGCGNDDPAPVDPTSAAAATSTPSTPEPFAAPTEPPLPDAATRPDKAGARAFITYYWDLLNYAQATGRSSAVKKSSAPSCDTCQRIASDISRHYDTGGKIVGGTNTVTIAKVVPLSLRDGTPIGFRIEHHVTNSPQTVEGGDGEKVEHPEATNSLTAYLQWIDDRWRMDALEVK